MDSRGAIDLTTRAQAALAFIAIQNRQRIFPNGGQVRRFLKLKHVRQGARVIEELIRAQRICRTDRGLEIATPAFYSQMWCQP